MRFCQPEDLPCAGGKYLFRVGKQFGKAVGLPRYLLVQREKLVLSAPGNGS